ncbi:MAG: hypothetical protein ACLSGA_03795 [Ruminococcus sp.]
MVGENGAGKSTFEDTYGRI